MKNLKKRKHSMESIGHFHSWAYKLGKLKISKTQAPQSLGLLGGQETPEKQLNEVEIGNLPEKGFKVMIVKMIQDLGKRMEAKIEKMKKCLTKT